MAPKAIIMLLEEAVEVLSPLMIAPLDLPVVAVPDDDGP